ncbi:hypothetical protein VTN49DRAFT_6951 [Thermomyces lanuginosus]|uniref:uncharacterized protein n=1 Tax=Thermomyces lanuginosus TaxID=5541 RepID=UPI00374207E4
MTSSPISSPDRIRYSSSPSRSPTSQRQPGISRDMGRKVDLPISPLPSHPLSASESEPPLPRGGHVRSRSVATTSSHSMTRAHSSPGLDSRGRYIYPGDLGRPVSPMDRAAHPQESIAENQTLLGLRALRISQPISEAAEPRSSSSSSYGAESETRCGGSSPALRCRAGNRRQYVHPIQTSFNHPISDSSSSAQSSPVTTSSRFNEPFPGAASSISSMPSTPTSFRSRSPSISSLETIPDIPDAEAAAVEDDQIARLKMAADRADMESMRRRNNWDLSPSSGLRGGYGSRLDKQRKRWSVCGAERRQDLDLETIWED